GEEQCAPSLVSVGGGTVPHRWCQWGEEQCPIVGVSGGRNSAPSWVSVGGGRNSAPSLVSVGGGIAPHRGCQWGEE
ncbi:unnamed protein product, partial [Staurois parvus]